LKGFLKACDATNILEARNGKEAVDIYMKEHNKIGLILMDINMPVMNGFEASTFIN